MDFAIPDELKTMQEMARDFVKKEVLPKVNEDEKNHRFPRETVRKMGELGFFGCPVPEEYGGSNTGYLAHTLLCEEISRVSGALQQDLTCRPWAVQWKSLFSAMKNKRKNISKSSFRLSGLVVSVSLSQTLVLMSRTLRRWQSEMATIIS